MRSTEWIGRTIVRWPRPKWPRWIPRSNWLAFVMCWSEPAGQALRRTVRSYRRRSAYCVSSYIVVFEGCCRSSRAPCASTWAGVGAARQRHPRAVRLLYAPWGKCGCQSESVSGRARPSGSGCQPRNVLPPRIRRPRPCGFPGRHQDSGKMAPSLGYASDRIRVSAERSRAEPSALLGRAGRDERHSDAMI